MFTHCIAEKRKKAIALSADVRILRDMTNTNITTARIITSSLVEEWANEDCDGGAAYDELSAYCLWRVIVDGAEYRVGACVGVPDHLRGTADAAGSIVGLVDAWWLDASDWQDLPNLETRDAVLDHLRAHARNLLREAIESR